MKLRCDIVMVVAMNKKLPTEMLGLVKRRIVCQNCEKKNGYNI
jgi:hypothetical protein